MKATDQLETKASADGYNKTQLNVEEDMSRHVYHRDRLAHFFRWSHMMRAMKQGLRIVDLGCGSGNLALMLYANRFNPELYLGVDIRGKTLESAASYWEGRKFPAEFLAADLCKDGWQQPVLDMFKEGRPDIITSFEFVEHIPGEQVEPFLKRVNNIMGIDTRFYLSTPCYDGIRKAENHIKEWYYQELKDVLVKWFDIEDHWGTFISQADFLAELQQGKSEYAGIQQTWDRLRTYYGSETLAVLFAPLFPEIARNCIWKLKIK